MEKNIFCNVAKTAKSVTRESKQGKVPLAVHTVESKQGKVTAPSRFSRAPGGC